MTGDRKSEPTNSFVMCITANKVVRGSNEDRKKFVSGDYRNLMAWQKAKSLALSIYRCTRDFPKDETYGLTSQMRRAAVSVPSNIAEGKGRYSHKDFVHFLYQARGSLLELETQLLIARDLQYIERPIFESLELETEELSRILNGLINRFQVEDRAVRS